MKINKLFIHIFLISFSKLILTMNEGLNTNPKKPVCKNAVVCDFTTALRKKYAIEGFHDAPESWLTPKQEVSHFGVHNEIVSFVSALPFPLTDSAGQVIPVTINPKSGNPTIEFKESFDYQTARQILERFNGPAGLDKAKRIFDNNSSLQLVYMFNQLNQKYCVLCSNQPNDRK